METVGGDRGEWRLLVETEGSGDCWWRQRGVETVGGDSSERPTRREMETEKTGIKDEH